MIEQASIINDSLHQELIVAFDTTVSIGTRQRWCTGKSCRKTPHRAKKVARAFAENEIEVLYWPGNSPDLNPIENLWSIVKLEQKKRDSGNKDKLKQVVIDIWFNNEKIQEYCKTLVDSMPSRIKQLIENNGGHINY